MPYTGQLGTVNSAPGNVELAGTVFAAPPILPIVAFTGRLGTQLTMPAFIELGLVPITTPTSYRRGLSWPPRIRSLTWHRPTRELTPMTPVIIMIPGENRVAGMPFDAYEEIAWRGDSLAGLPTVVLVAAAGNSGSVIAGTISLYPSTGGAYAVDTLMNATAAANGDSYTVTVTCSTTDGSTLVAVGLLQIKAQP